MSKPVSRQYKVAKGVFLALELLHTHLAATPSSLGPSEPNDHKATLALLLHALVLLVPSRPGLYLRSINVGDGSGRPELVKLNDDTLRQVREHPEFSRWNTPPVVEVIQQSHLREELAETAVRVHGLEMRNWYLRHPSRRVRLVGENAWKAQVLYSLDQILDLLLVCH